VINTGVSGTAIDTDGALTANLDTLLASQKAVKTYADTKSMKNFAGGFDRDISLVTDLSITGLGFTPTSISFLSTKGGTTSYSLGFCDSVLNQNCIYTCPTNHSTDSTRCIMYHDGTNYNAGKVTSFDADGFTLAWDKSGSPTGSLTVKYIAYR